MTEKKPPPDPALVAAIRELESHAAGSGWDQPAALFALVSTVDLLEREPHLADLLGVDPDAHIDPGELTPIEQEIDPGTELEDLLAEIEWPDEVAGAAVVVERLILPPAAEDDVPPDAGEARSYAAEHPDREEVRIVAGVRREGDAFCALRLRSHDDPEAVVAGPEVVPGLLELLRTTFAEHR